MQFRYKVINEEVRLVEGVLEATDREEARRIIADNRWQIISVEEVRGLERLLGQKMQGKIKYEEVSAFCTQLAMMIRSGANLVRGLEILHAQTEDRRLKETIGGISRGVSRGKSLAQSMRDTRGALPELLVSLVYVGEESGSLDSVLSSMATYYERENFVRKKIVNAAIYPAILFLVLIGLIFFFMNFILPSLMDLLTQSDQPLPMITQMVINVANFMQAYGIYVFLGLSVLVAGLFKLFQIPKYRYYLDSFLVRTPLLGKNLKDVVIARFSRTLALFLHSSIPIVTTLESLEKIMGNEVPRLAVARAKERIIRGETMVSAFGQESFFDPLVIQMMSIGEETGRLEELMGEVANHYDKRVEIGIAKMVAMVEPVFTVIIGAVAGVLIIAISLPIFTMSTYVK